MGLGCSATVGAKIVLIRATKLQIPIEVARLRYGKIVSSTKEAKYVIWKRIFIEILVNKMNIGMIILK